MALRSSSWHRCADRRPAFGPTPPLITQTGPHRQPRASSRRRKAFVVGGLALLLITAAGTALVAFRYLPALAEARQLRADVELTATRVRAAGLYIDGPTFDLVVQDLAAAHERLDRLSALLAEDPIIGLARVFPPTQADVRGADSVAEAAQELLEAADEGVVIGKQFVAIEDAFGTAPETALPCPGYLRSWRRHMRTRQRSSGPSPAHEPHSNECRTASPVRYRTPDGKW